MTAETESTPGARCAQCGGAIPAGKRKGTKFCSPACNRRKAGLIYQRDRRKAGLCQECSKPAMSRKTRCRDCRDKRRSPKGE